MPNAPYDWFGTNGMYQRGRIRLRPHPCPDINIRATGNTLSQYMSKTVSLGTMTVSAKVEGTLM